MSKRRVSPSDLDSIAKYYRNTPPDSFDLSALANELGRTKQFVCRLARGLGLTIQHRPPSETTLQLHKRVHKDKWANRSHPRGFLGKKHTPETLRVLSDTSRRAWATMKTFGTGNMSLEALEASSKRMSLIASKRQAENVFTRVKGGRRSDLDNKFFRSAWEANYARYLNLLMTLGAVESWEFEPETFWFEGIRRGTLSYKPDFRVFYRGDPVPEYVEIKGWIMPKDRTKWRRMKKYHPTIKLVIVNAKQYYAIQRKWASSIPNWERKIRPNKDQAIIFEDQSAA